jgi:hypothetical protein
VRAGPTTSANSARTWAIFRRSWAEAEELGEAGGAQGLESAVREDLLDLAKRSGEGSGEDLQGRKAPLELGYLDGDHLRASLEGREALLELTGASGEAGDLFREVGLEAGARAPEPEVSPDRSHRRHEGERRADEDEYHEYGGHSGATVPRGRAPLQTLERW